MLSPSPTIMGEWNCGCGSLCSSRQLGRLLFILGRLCSSPSLPRHDLTLSQIIPGRQNGVSDQCCLHFTDGKTEAPRDLNRGLGGWRGGEEKGEESFNKWICTLGPDLAPLPMTTVIWRWEVFNGLKLEVSKCPEKTVSH